MQEGSREMHGWRAGITGGDEVPVGLRLQRASTVTVSGNGTKTSGQSLSAERRRVVWLPDPTSDQ